MFSQAVSSTRFTPLFFRLPVDQTQQDTQNIYYFPNLHESLFNFKRMHNAQFEQEVRTLLAISEKSAQQHCENITRIAAYGTSFDLDMFSPDTEIFYLPEIRLQSALVMILARHGESSQCLWNRSHNETSRVLCQLILQATEMIHAY